MPSFNPNINKISRKYEKNNLNKKNLYSYIYPIRIKVININININLLFNSYF